MVTATDLGVKGLTNEVQTVYAWNKNQSPSFFYKMLVTEIFFKQTYAGLEVVPSRMICLSLVG